MSNLKINSRRKTLLPLQNESPKYKIQTRRSIAFATTPVSKQIDKASLINNEITKTPTAAKETKDDDEVFNTPKAKGVMDPIMEKIKRDLNSPSATARLRAQRALKSPDFLKATYAKFDVPHEEQDLLTEEERQPYKPKTIREIFANCRIYVEARTDDDNRSAGIKNKLLSYGIKVNEKLYKDTTHVIFKDGLLSTYKQAKKLGIPVTTILWIEACIEKRRLIDVTMFPIRNLERYENPDVYGRVRRQKSMQPIISKTIVSLKPKCKTQIDDAKDKTIFNESNSDSEVTLKASCEMEMTPNASEKSHTSMNSNSSSSEIVTQVDMSVSTPANSISRRRLTTFTPHTMEQTEIDNALAWKSVDRRRRTIFTSHLDETTLISQKTPTMNAAKALFFNSANRIGNFSRRSVLDISINILEMNCKAMSEAKEKDEDKRIEESKDTPNDSLVSTQKAQTGVIRKRKLFSTELLDETIEAKENFGSDSKKVKCNKKVKQNNPKLSVNDSRTENHSSKPVFFKSTKASETNISKTFKPSQNYIVCTNLSSDEKKFVQSAITKLGGIFEEAVSQKTTHIITPNVERTMNLLRAVISACFIMKVEWIYDSINAGKFLDTTIYQHHICNTQKIYERKILGKNFRNLTFSHYGPFFISKDTIDNGKKFEYLKEIIEKCNGILTKNKHEAKVIVSDRPIPFYPSITKPTIVVSTYIFDAAMKGKMIPTAKYAPSK